MERDSSAELHSLRREVQELLQHAGELARRIEALESSQAPPPAPLSPVEREIILSSPQPPPPPIPEPPKPKVATPYFVPPPIPVSPPPREAIFAKAPPEPRPPAPKRDWELYLGSYLGPRIAIVVLATAAVFFLAYALREWGPPVRVAIGYAVTVALLAAGYFLEKKQPDYARVLYSGGFLMSYFVTYAAHYIEGARVIENPYVGLTLLTLVVAAWAVAVQLRKSLTMAFLVVALGHFTIFLSGPGPASAFAIVLLSAGAAFFLLRNLWYYVAAAGIVGSYVNQALWMLHNQGQHRPVDFWICLAFLVAHFLIFAFAELFAREELRRKIVPTWFRSIFVTLNSAAFVSLAYLLMREFAFTSGHQDVLLFCHAVVLVLIGLCYLRLREGDPLYNTYLTKGVAVATMGLGLRYGGSQLTTWLSVETVVLLVSARRSGLIVTRLLALAVGCLALLYGVYTFQVEAPIYYGMAGYWPRALEVAMTVLSFLAASLLYERTDWDARSPRGDTLHFETREPLWALGFLSEPPMPGMKRPLEGLSFPFAYAVAAFVIFLLNAWNLVGPGDRTLAMALPALALTAAAALLGSKPYGLDAVMLVVVAAVLGTAEFATAKTRALGVSVPVATIALQALTLTAIFSEKILGGYRPGLYFHRTRTSPYFLYAIPGWLLGLLLFREFPGAGGPIAVVTAGIVIGVTAQWLHPRAVAAVSTGLLFWALGVLVRIRGDWFEFPFTWHFITWTLVVLPLLLDRFYLRYVRRMRMNGFDWALAALSWLALLHAANRGVPEGWAFLTIALCAFAYLAYGLNFQSKPAGAASLVAAIYASLAIAKHSYLQPMASLSTSALVMGYLALAGYWILLERLTGLEAFRKMALPRGKVRNVCVGVATVLLVLMLGRVPGIHEHWLTASWAVLAFALFGLAIVFRSKPYRFAALGVIGLALLRAYIVDAWSQSGLMRVAAFVAVFIVMLLFGYAYLQMLDYLRARDNEDEEEEEEKTE